MEKSVKSLLFNLLVPFVQWEGVGSIEGAERKSGRSGEEENQNTKFSAWVVFSKWNLKSSETQWSPLFPLFSAMCVWTYIGGWLVVGYLFKSAQQWTCLAFAALVAQLYVCHSSWIWAPPVTRADACIYFFPSPSSFSRSVGGWSEIKNRNYVWLLLHPDLPSEISLS